MRVIPILARAGLLTGRATKQTGTTGANSGATSDVRIVKSIDGTYDGEIVSTISPKSRFAKLKIGMSMSDVNTLIEAPDDIHRHETGKRWIPFYFGNDAQRLQAYYAGDGCLTYTAGNVFGGGGNQLIRITADTSRICFE